MGSELATLSMGYDLMGGSTLVVVLESGHINVMEIPLSVFKLDPSQRQTYSYRDTLRETVG